MESEEPENPLSTLASKLRFNHKPHLDVCLQGILRLEETSFKSVEEYSDDPKKCLTENGV